MTASLLVAAFTTAADVLAVAERRTPGSGAAFAALDDEKQQYAVETAALGIKALHFKSTFVDADRAEWRLEQANIEYALFLAPSFAPDAVADPLNPENADDANVQEVEVGPIREKKFARSVIAAGSLEVFPPVVRSLLDPLLAKNEVIAARNYGQGAVRRRT